MAKHISALHVREPRTALPAYSEPELLHTLAQEYPRITPLFLREQLGEWVGKVEDPEILPRWMRLICTIVTLDPALEPHRLTAPSSRLSDSIIAILHYPTYCTPSPKEYGVVKDLRNRYISLVDQKMRLNGALTLDVVPWRTRRRGTQDFHPYKRELSVKVLKEFENFTKWIVDNSDAKMIISFGREAKTKTRRCMPKVQTFSLDDTTTMYGMWDHAAVEVKSDGS